ncbi:putative phage abortive infection protein [Paucibacter sp. O1-1]|nr:putative phage abortive infection protein [Paucibacter sp. O1-1]MCU7369517.1 putative phage abortive infection protein [Paucibacter sp. O1-1]MDA3824476.1 putative phage abortive infection protein [Paucibacter sp. O1-1]MDA3824501.1 putative phage abortive infection protein [Paucibacter sp. O1-1]
MFLLWSALMIVLFMVMAAPLPDRLRAFGLVAAVMTVWVLWALYGVEFLADRKWPQAPDHVRVAVGQPAEPGVSSAPADAPTVRLGQVGDLFGGVNALFAALAFAGVGIAAFQQWKSTRIAFKQSIESTFFSAVELHHRIADGLRFDRVHVFPAYHQSFEELARLAGTAIPKKGDPVAGRQVFPEVIQAISHGGAGTTAYEKLVSNYEVLQDKHNYVLGHYFRNLYQILKLLDSDDALDAAGRQKYASVLRAQLSSDELALLMVNCADKMVDDGEFRSLVVRYRLLEHIPMEKVGSEYLYTGQKGHVVLADEASIQQYLTESAVLRTPRTYQGAFGTNPALARE